jgi:acetyl esterase/lipase
MTDQTNREAILREIAKKTVRYSIPGMNDVPVRQGQTYRATSGTELPFDVYHPHARDGRRAPVVVIAIGYPDPAGQIRTYGPMTSWARLLAASGIAVVVYGSSAPADDIHAVLDHLRAAADALAIDATRIALLSMSGSGCVALSTLMRDRTLKAAALLCGYTMDADGGTAIADMSSQYGFVDACAGRSVDDLPRMFRSCLFVQAASSLPV